MSPPGRAAQPRARTGHDLRFYDRGWPRYAHGVARLRDSIATPAGKAPYVRRLFSTIADRYDLITVWLSYGQDRRWKRQLVASAGPLPTGAACSISHAAPATSHGSLPARGAHVVGLDITPRMIELARAKAPAHREVGAAPAFLVGDMCALPVPDASFDIVTTGYGLRNVPDLRSAVREIARVLRPDGLFLSLDFNRPANPLVRHAYHAYLSAVGSGARVGAAPRSGYVPLHTRVDPRLPGCARGRRPAAVERIFRRALAARARGLDGDSRGHAPIVAPSGTR